MPWLLTGLCSLIYLLDGLIHSILMLFTGYVAGAALSVLCLVVIGCGTQHTRAVEVA